MKYRPDFKRTCIKQMVVLCSVILGFTGCHSQNADGTDATTSTTTETDVVSNQNVTKQDTAMSSATNGTSDAQFLVEAADINHTEINLGQLAQKNTKTPDVLALAKMMVTDHNKALTELKALADKKSVTLPNGPSSTADNDKLMNLKGKDFDNAYCAEMVNGHQKAIEKFEAASKNSKDEEVKSWATKMLPALRMHLQHSMDCQKKTASM